MGTGLERTILLVLRWITCSRLCLRLYPRHSGNSMDASKECTPLGGDGHSCIPGCSPPGQQCHELRRWWGCSFPPERLREALQAQLDVGLERGGVRNNEMVIDAREYAEGLPTSLLGFFYQLEEERPYMSRMRAAFARQYPDHLSPPLVKLDRESARPFTLAV